MRVQDAVQLLDQVATQGKRQRLTPNYARADGEGDWEFLTRRAPAGLMAERWDQANRLHLGEEARIHSRDQQRPPVLVWAADRPPLRMAGVLSATGGSAMARRPLQERRRMRLWALGDPDAAPASPEGAWALTTTVLGALRTAQELDDWALQLGASDSRRARTEAGHYFEHAKRAEDRLAASFEGWLPDVLDTQRAATQAPPVVAAQPHGFIGLGPA